MDVMPHTSVEDRKKLLTEWYRKQMQQAVPEVLASAGLPVSGRVQAGGFGEARRLIQQGGVAVNDQKVASIDVTFDQEQFAGDGVVIKKGKKVFHRVYTA